MVIDHIGIVVKSMDEGIAQWTNVFGYAQMTGKVVNTLQQVTVVFMKKEGSLPVKLLEPVSEKSPIYGFAARGGGIHHICFKTDNLDKTIDTFGQMKNEVRILVKPQPGEAFENENIAFALAKNNLNIELIDTDKRANIIA
ncbi:MAG: VOC family protein [Bacteroidales bacterium]|nr:VOC family protein [Bacteroidales bacterium]